jgi:hypothetical protein
MRSPCLVEHVPTSTRGSVKPRSNKKERPPHGICDRVADSQLSAQRTPSCAQRFFPRFRRRYSVPLRSGNDEGIEGSIFNISFSRFPLQGLENLLMAMEDDGQAKEILLATAQRVHAHLGSSRNRQPHWSNVSRSRKDPSWKRRRSSADQQPNASREVEGDGGYLLA